MIPHHHYYKKPQDNNKYMDLLQLGLMLGYELVCLLEHIDDIGMSHNFYYQLFLLRLVLFHLMVLGNKKLLFHHQMLLQNNNTYLLHHTHKYYMEAFLSIRIMLFDTAFDNKYQHLYKSKILL